MAEEKELKVDLDGYKKCMNTQAERGRSSVQFDVDSLK